MTESPLVVFFLADATALGLVGAAMHLLRRPHSPYIPTPLKHRWSVGLFCIAALYLLLAVPFMALGDVLVGTVAFAATTLVLAFGAREFLWWIRDDLAQHRRDRRTLFEHSGHCVVGPDAGPSGPEAAHH